MAKRTRGARAAGSGSDEPEERPATAASEPEEPAGKRLGIQLDAEGRIAWDRLRDRTRDELKTMLSDPRIASELGAAPQVATAHEPIDGSTVGMLYGALGALMVGAAKAAGYPDDQAMSLHFTTEEKDALLAPTSKVLAKYSGSLGKWEDEIMLSFALGSIVFAKVTALRKPAQVIKMAERRPAADPVAEVPDPALM